jgi:hypothetical protein
MLTHRQWSFGERELHMRPSPLWIDRETKEVPCQIKSEWLGAETHVYLPPRMSVGNRFMLWSRWLSVRSLLFSFSSGLAMGGCLALFAWGHFGTHHRPVGHGKRSDPFGGSREVTPCLE